MSTIKYGQISLFCHLNKTLKGLRTSFQSPTLSKSHLEVAVIEHADI